MEPGPMGAFRTGNPMTAPEIGPRPPGGLLRRFGFRFVAAYLLILNTSTLLRLLPLLGRYSYYPELVWRYVVLWTERVVLRMTELSSIKSSGSGDTSFLWARCACMLAVALAAASIWVFFDRKRRWDPLLGEFLRICVRYALASILIGYGLSKIIPPLQFPAPWAGRLLEPVGRLSPMGMLWTFMGASRAYTTFSGIMELAGGLLLLFRRSALLGALVSAGVLLNIVLLNFCYDVPVKLFSLQLLLMAGFLIWPDMRKLASVLILNRPAESASLTPPWRTMKSRLALCGLKILVIASLVFGQIEFRLSGNGAEILDPPTALLQLTGIWEVDRFGRDGVLVPQALTDLTRWRRVIFDQAWGGLRFNAFGVENGMIAGWQVAPESTGELLVLVPSSKENPRVTMRLVQSAPDRLDLNGTVRGHKLVVSLHRADPVETRLLNRGFHWISEVPFNR